MVKLKNKYALIELISEHAQSVNEFSFYQAICKIVGDLHGDWGFSGCSFLQVRVHDGSIMLLKMPAEFADIIMSALPFITVVGGKEFVIKTIFMGRSVRSCELKLIDIRRQELYAQLKETHNLYERRKIMKAIRSVSGKVLIDIAVKTTG